MSKDKVKKMAIDNQIGRTKKERYSINDLAKVSIEYDKIHDLIIKNVILPKLERIKDLETKQILQDSFKDIQESDPTNYNLMAFLEKGIKTLKEA